MVLRNRPRVSIVDFGMGNLFSVQQACRVAEIDATIDADPQALLNADGLILPGVGAFADAMAVLRQRRLIDPLLRRVGEGVPLMGVCLGLQLLMGESLEFGRHAGLGLIEGTVRHLRDPAGANGGVGNAVKVPHVGWEPIRPARDWQGSLLEGVPADAQMYFVHSFYIEPHPGEQALATASHGALAFACAIERANIFACQFHPERSGAIGLQVYRNFSRRLLGP